MTWNAKSRSEKVTPITSLLRTLNVSVSAGDFFSVIGAAFAGYLPLTDFDGPPASLARVDHHLRKTRKDIHLSAMRAHLGAHREGEFRVEDHQA